jgi:ribosomal-protein-alanine N-acetyltransferase
MDDLDCEMDLATKATLPYRIRPMQSGDIPMVAALERRIFLDPWPFSAYVQELHFNASARYFVLELVDLKLARRRWPWKSPRASFIIGYAGMRWEGEVAHISTLAVREDWRGLGLGDLLLLSVLEDALDYGARSVRLEVRASNAIAQSLYRKYGFKIKARLSRYYRNGEDAYLMHIASLDEGYRQRLARYRDDLRAKLIV